jgi:hypothetical protein
MGVPTSSMNKEKFMYIGNHRYFLDRQRHDLALRMIRHEARTCTIRSTTGLTDDRIRRLHKTYTSQSPALAFRRHRGKSPRRANFFTRNTQTQFESSMLACTFSSFGLLTGESAKSGPLERGRLFCDAFETHQQLCGIGTISFEHAWFLLQLLQQNSLVRIARCRHCDGQYLRNPQQPGGRSCPICKLNAPPKARRVRVASPATRRIAGVLKMPTQLSGTNPPLSGGC